MHQQPPHTPLCFSTSVAKSDHVLAVSGFTVYVVTFVFSSQLELTPRLPNAALEPPSGPRQRDTRSARRACYAAVCSLHDDFADYFFSLWLRMYPDKRGTDFFAFYSDHILPALTIPSAGKVPAPLPRLEEICNDREAAIR